MKVLRKGKKYTRVSPLPKGWHGEKEIAKAAEQKNKYQSSFRELKKLLDDGWQYCSKDEEREATKREEAKKEKKKDDK